MDNFNEFLLWEKTTRDTIDFKKVYVDVADDLIAGLLLSQIIYWYLPSGQRQSKLRVEKDGHLWIAKSHADWYEEVRITEWQAPRALTKLEERGIIEKRIYRFDGSPTVHIRIIEEKFLEMLSKLVHVPNGNERNARNQTSERLETLTETTTKTTAENLKDIPTPHQRMFSALVKVTRMDHNISSNRGMLNRASKELRDAGYTDDDVLAFGENWKSDWRFKNPPALSTIKAEISKAKTEEEKVAERYAQTHKLVEQRRREAEAEIEKAKRQGESNGS